jgi:hypothetical protein
MPARKLDEGNIRVQLRQANPALCDSTLTGWHARKPVHDVPVRSVPLRHALVEFAERFEILWVEVAVHNVNDFVLHEPTWQDHVAISILISRPDFYVNWLSS